MLSRLLHPLTDSVYATLRIIVGLLFAFHGLQKVFGILSQFQPPVGSQLWIGGVIELVTGLMIACGFLITGLLLDRTPGSGAEMRTWWAGRIRRIAARQHRSCAHEDDQDGCFASQLHGPKLPFTIPYRNYFLR